METVDLSQIVQLVTLFQNPAENWLSIVAILLWPTWMLIGWWCTKTNSKVDDEFWGKLTPVAQAFQNVMNTMAFNTGKAKNADEEAVQEERISRIVSESVIHTLDGVARGAVDQLLDGKRKD